MSSVPLFYIDLVCIGSCCVFLFNRLAIFSSLFILKVVHHVRLLTDELTDADGLEMHWQSY